MVTARAPDPVRELARARAAARQARDWAEADRLRAEIEAAGWRVVDHGTRFDLLPAAPPDVVEGDRIRYGSSGSVPSRLTEAETVDATVVVRATDTVDDLLRLIEGLRRHAPAGTQVVIVADAPSAEVEAALKAADGQAALPVGGRPPEVVWTVVRLGPVGSASAGLRRAVGRVVILLDPCVEATDDIVTPLVRSLDDPMVGVSGGWGLTSVDLRHWEAAPPGGADVVDAEAIAFRREDLIARGPLDEGFRTGPQMARWWSLVLRDAGEGNEPRRAVVPDRLPIVRHEVRDDESVPSEEWTRLGRRDFYRLLDRFGRRPDLLGSRPGV